MSDKTKTLLIFAGFLGFLIGLILGACTGYKIKSYQQLRCRTMDTFEVRLSDED
jgi:ABC-type dipeptide/oligopeptide/nickel transport system permease subunit